MEVVCAVLGSLAVEPCRAVTSSITVRIRNFLKCGSNLNALENKLANLLCQRDDLKSELEAAIKQGKSPTALVQKWLSDVDAIECYVKAVRASRQNVRGIGLDVRLRYRLSKVIVRKRKEVELLLKGIPSTLVAANHLPMPIEHIPGPSVETQFAASNNLAKIIDQLNKPEVRTIGVWGMGGVGKTTLVRNLNNMLKNSSNCSLVQPFSMVIWITVSKDFNLSRLQMQIAERFMLVIGKEREERMAIRLHERFQMEKNFLLILDDLWEAIDLDRLGVPRSDVHSGGKIILTSRSAEVCAGMMTDIDLKVDTLTYKEAWSLFCSKSGNVATTEHVQPFAEAVVTECRGLPLALITVGSSMRGKTKVELWKDALNALQMSVPLITGIEDKVYKPLKWSYDSLHGDDIKSCFLYCCLYQEDYRIDVRKLIRCWFCEGLLDENQNYEVVENRGMAIIQSLKDSCLLEEDDIEGFVKMHDVIRDVAIWIASSLEDGSKSLVRSGRGLSQISDIDLWRSSRRVSFMENHITQLPDYRIQCPQTLTLLLQGNAFFRIPDNFLQGFQQLRVLDLSSTRIRSLPLSLLQLGELRALHLNNCSELRELPTLDRLSRLQVLECGSTSIQALPEGMEKLTNLRRLDLAKTGRLTIIPGGIISKLSKLEFLNMKGSSYKWCTISNVQKGQASLEELLCLECLRVLRIQFGIGALSFDSEAMTAWIKRLGNFELICSDLVHYGEYFEYENESRVCTTRAMPPFCSKRRVVIRNSSLKGVPLHWLFINATSVSLQHCHDISSSLCELALMRNRVECFAGLTSLTFVNTKFDHFYPVVEGCGSQFDVLPNLEHLILSTVHFSDRNMTGLVDCLSLRFSKLKSLIVHKCTMLKYILSIGGSILNLEKLEEIKVHQCYELEELFRYEGASSVHPVFPNLRIMELHEVPKLKTLCGGTELWPRLERLIVIKCQLIRKLPLTVQNAASKIDIEGESHWWSQLEWDDENTKSSLQHCFTTVRPAYLSAPKGLMRAWTV